MTEVHIIHEYGAPSHFYGLDRLLAENGVSSDKHELNLWGQAKRVVKTGYPKVFGQLLGNLGFLLSLPFLQPSKVVLGIAPYNPVLRVLMPFLKRHRVYYFTSYTCWDGSRQVHRGGPRTRAAWRTFLKEHVSHVFAVSETSATELVRNGLAEKERVSVVGHSYRVRPEPAPFRRKDNRFITVANLEPHKGIGELIACFEARPEADLTIVGKGSLEKAVREAAARCPNIHYEGYIADQQVLFDYYRKASFFILNSRRRENWEELFGMALIEASACGAVPLASDHSGPREILRNPDSGVLFPEGNVAQAVDACLRWSDETYNRVRTEAIRNGSRYHVSAIAPRWARILE